MNFSQKYKKYRDKYLNFVQLGGFEFNYSMPSDLASLFRNDILSTKFLPAAAGGISIIQIDYRKPDRSKKFIHEINKIIRANGLKLIRVNSDDVIIPDAPLDLSLPAPENIFFRIERNLDAEADKAKVMKEEEMIKAAKQADLRRSAIEMAEVSAAKEKIKQEALEAERLAKIEATEKYKAREAAMREIAEARAKAAEEDSDKYYNGLSAAKYKTAMYKANERNQLKREAADLADSKRYIADKN